MFAGAGHARIWGSSRQLNMLVLCQNDDHHNGYNNLVLCENDDRYDNLSGIQYHAT